MKMNNLSRREMLALSAKVAATATFATQVPGAMAFSKTPSASSPAPVNEYGGYSGNKNFKYVNTPATYFDFGLTPDQEAHAVALHKKIVCVDMLMECTFYPGLISNAKKGGITAGNLSIGITDMFGWTPDNKFKPEDWWTWQSLKGDLERLPALMKTFDKEMMLTLTHDDILAAKKAGKLGIIPGTQNTQFIGRDIAKLKEAYDMGLRIVQLTYNPTNFVGSGSLELPTNRYGLSTLGERVVAEMNELGMLIDTGHSSPETMIRAAEVSEKPIAISHAGMFSKVAQFRSTTDEALKTVADKGGVYGVISTPAAIAGSDRCTVQDYLDNIDHAVNIVGTDAVGFGSDLIIPSTFEQVLTAPSWDPEVVAKIGSFEVWPWSDGHVGYENNAGAINLTRGLVQRGYSDEDISKIMGGNWLRLLKDTIG